MQTSTLVLLACLVAAAVAWPAPADEDQILAQELGDAPALERGARQKRGLLLLKKKLLLGALGLKAAKVGAVGGAVAGAALAAKKSHPPKAKIVSLPYNSYGHSSWH
ncbi:hypothetical protein JYU34_003345 [Plutella xylostella]|uniref:Uncharacterized protein n=1 Tax=Plutella xylostella TaxID=51655 RepID=A0ABQ7QZT3_PLUXY|nr:uncharacterized protein LOC105389303 isoform X2 [Plutella xylostella]KAG7310554.1 hypothetical protein JYU34_003345 [Plutella xylostella]